MGKENRFGVDIAVVKNAAMEQGVPLSEIALFYQDLTEQEISRLLEKGLVTDQTEARVIAKFDDDGNALFPEKISEVYTLSS